mgnify:CR=1 FL=1
MKIDFDKMTKDFILNEGKKTCVFENPLFIDFNIVWWKELPKNPPKVKNDTKYEQQDSKTDPA